MGTVVYRSHIIFLLGTVFATSKIIYVEQNETVVLPCNDSSSETWLGPPNLTTYYTGNKINPKLPHYRRLSIEKRINLQFNLKIVNFSKQDEGRYKCMEQNDSFFDLKIPVNPSNMTIDGENETHFVNGFEGAPLTIFCRVVSGDPVEEIILSTENVTLNHSSHGAVWYSVVPSRNDHMRNVTCTAVVKQTSFILHRTVQIFLKLSPVISIIPGPNITAVENGKLNINCTFNSNNPIKQVKWTYNGSDRTKTVLSYKPVLTLPRVKRQDTGTYTCTVENSVTAVNSSVILNVQYIDFNFTDSGSGKLLRCIPRGLTNDYKFFRWEHKTEYGDHVRFLSDIQDGNLFFAHEHGHRNWTYQNGVYVCSVSTSMSVEASNTISSQYKVAEPGPPHFVSSNKKIQYGSLGSVATIIADFISYTVDTDINVNTDVQGEVYYSMERNVKINEMMFGKYATLKGSRIYVQKQLKSLNDFQQYLITVSNMFGSSVITVYLTQLELTDSTLGTKDIATYTVFSIALFGTTVVAIVIYLIMKRRQQQENNTIRNSSPDNQTEHRVQYEEIDSAFYVTVDNNQPHASAPQIQLNLQTGNVAFNRETVSPQLAHMSLSELIDSVTIIQSDQSEESSEISYLNPSKPYTELQYQTDDTYTLHQYEKVNQWTPNKICTCDVSSALASHIKLDKKRSTI